MIEQQMEKPDFKSLPPVLRVELPSGGWWDLRTPRRFGVYLDWSETLGGGDHLDWDFRAVAAITYGWSFGEVVSMESLRERDTEDLIAVLQVYSERLQDLFLYVRPASRKSGSSGR